MISTKRLTLRPLKKATPRQVAWLNDPNVVRFSEQRHQRHTLHSQLNYVTGFPGFIWGIHLVDSGEHIGNLGAAIDLHNQVADVGIIIGDQSCWGKGMGFEAWDAACSWLLSREGGAVRKLEAGCMKTNEAMLRIIKKSRFAQEGERVNHFIVNGAPVTAVLFGRTQA
jgi:RimJ/RimL family protein N-acetyltransferase